MGFNKYSPTVSDAYAADQEWHNKHCEEGNWYDRDGYDSYGYNEDGYDRAGNHEDDDYLNWDDQGREIGRELYDDTYDEWGFDGTRPVLLKTPKIRWR